MIERNKPARQDLFRLAAQRYPLVPDLGGDDLDGDDLGVDDLGVDLAASIDPGVARQACIEADQMLRAVLARHRRHRR